MRNKFASEFAKMAQYDDSLVMVVADISPAGAMNDFRQASPDRFVNTGVSEQSMIGIAAGLAMAGFRPFAYTIASFALFRCFEFVRLDLAYQELPVTVVGMGGGVTYSTLGFTHHAVEDVAVARVVPGLNVLAPCDPYEVVKLTQWSGSHNQRPQYLRLGKVGEPELLTDSSDSEVIVGKLRYLKRGSDICIIGYGPILGLGLMASDKLKQRGIDISVISCHTLDPLDEYGIRQMLETYDRIVVIEEHVFQGGLGQSIREMAFRENAVKQVSCIHLQSEFIHHYGSHAEILEKHGVTLEHVIKVCLEGED